MSTTIYTARQYVAVKFVSTDARDAAAFAAATVGARGEATPHFIVEARRGEFVIAEVDVYGAHFDQAASFEHAPRRLADMERALAELAEAVAEHDAAAEQFADEVDAEDGPVKMRRPSTWRSDLRATPLTVRTHRLHLLARRQHPLRTLSLRVATPAERAAWPQDDRPMVTAHCDVCRQPLTTAVVFNADELEALAAQHQADERAIERATY